MKLGAGLIRWLRSHGGFFDGRLFFQDSPDRGVGVYTTENIAQGQEVVRLPGHLIVGSDRQSVIREQFDQVVWPTEFALDASQLPFLADFAELCATLVFESRNPMASKPLFGGYVEVLPSVCPANLANANESTWRWIPSTPARDFAAWMQAAICGARHLLSLLKVSSSTALWAVCMVMSRAFMHPNLGIVLLPVLDALNHGSNAEISFGSLRDVVGRRGPWRESLITGAVGMSTVSILASKDLVAGEEVAWNYGQRSNIEFLLAYGFALPDSEASTPVSVHFPWPVAPTNQRCIAYGLDRPLTGELSTTLTVLLTANALTDSFGELFSCLADAVEDFGDVSIDVWSRRSKVISSLRLSSLAVAQDWSAALAYLPGPCVSANRDVCDFDDLLRRMIATARREKVLLLALGAAAESKAISLDWRSAFRAARGYID